MKTFAVNTWVADQNGFGWTLQTIFSFLIVNTVWNVWKARTVEKMETLDTFLAISAIERVFDTTTNGNSVGRDNCNQNCKVENFFHAVNIIKPQINSGFKF